MSQLEPAIRIAKPLFRAEVRRLIPTFIACIGALYAFGASAVNGTLWLQVAVRV
jgi:hypothetical protein